MSTITVESILQQVEQLPPPEQRRLRLLLKDEPRSAKVKAPLDKRLPPKPMKDRTREMAWLKEHQHEYAGQWVALDGDRLIAASANRLDISAAVKADGAHLPLIHRIAAPDEPLPMGI
ncbi:MAG TPA: DUF5678 domain-containing protein [Blastocatellia bacterium]|nr:DUF5678 domain-containing protein [Blastocatellia bacterium]HMV83814.1 DUF5678 domain-containing protein [Blastocatellia bacterium]HMX29396.1 DUF5678 domain-containing protein [Blastocatellia bacterium]HMY75112.1 DUF5678 domain-containing protein [Blastocatellia bacterium]HMZ22750.1 DUF5678 domain-containing protein [Blastocatellia bacterium]